jgi:hypothetical protein
MDLICIDSVGANRHTTSDAAKVLTAECPRRFFRALTSGCTRRRRDPRWLFMRVQTTFMSSPGMPKKQGAACTIRF